MVSPSSVYLGERLPTKLHTTGPTWILEAARPKTEKITSTHTHTHTHTHTRTHRALLAATYPHRMRTLPISEPGRMAVISAAWSARSANRHSRLMWSACRL